MTVPQKARRKKTSKSKKTRNRSRRKSKDTDIPSPEEVTEQVREELQRQLDEDLPKGFQIMDTKITKRKKVEVWVRGQPEYPKLKFNVGDESEGIRQYRQIVPVTNPSKANFGVVVIDK